MEKEELKESIEKHAKENNMELNENEKAVEGIMNGLLRNKETKGELYCPCRMTIGDKEKDKLIICPCVYHYKEVDTDGHCTCRLFFKK